MWRACAGALLCAVGLAAEAAPGDWDHSFGVAGRVPLSIAANGTYRVWKQQADGKIVTAGYQADTTGTRGDDFLIARFNSDGTPDTTLDGDGVLLVNLDSFTSGLDLEVLPDGRLLFAAQADRDDREVRLLRFNRDGSPDTSFGTSGQVSLTDPEYVQNPLIALTPSGAAYFLAHAGDSTSGIVVARVTADGVLDTSFGSGGRSVVDAPVALRPQIIRSDASGALVMGGSSGPLATAAPFVARLTNSGQLDSSFGDNGIVVMPFLQGEGWVDQLAIAADGKILAAGERFDANGTTRHFVARLNTNGTFDAGFGSGGRLVAPDGIHSMLLEPDGKLLLGGTIHELRPRLAWLARYNSDGSPDVTFGLRGRILEELARRLDRPKMPIAPDALARLARHAWPGNVRELRNVIEQAAVLGAGDAIEEHDLRLRDAAHDALGSASENDRKRSFSEAKREAVFEFERSYLLSALRANGGNVSRTAAAIGMVRQSLQQKMRELGLRAELDEGMRDADEA
jgi:uncharacterized delta-60 repeat protein